MRENTQEGHHGHWHSQEQHAGHGPWQHSRGYGWGRHRGGRRGPWGGYFPEGSEHWGGFYGPRGFGGGRERLERGALRYLILSILKDGPKHGYDIMKQMEERTMGFYSPSPGTLYPTLQLLEDQELVHSDQEADKRVYNITDKGRAELETQSGMVEGFWSRFQNRWGSGQTQTELKFAGDALKDLLRTVVEGFKSGALRGDAETVRKLRAAIERCENDIREIIAQSASGRATQETNPAGQGNPAQPGNPGGPEQPDTGAGTVRF